MSSGPRVFLCSPWFLSRTFGARRLTLRGMPCRTQARWALAAAYRSFHRDVVELAPFPRAPQQEAAATHVPAAHEVRGKDQARAERREEDVHVFARRDA